MRFDYAALLHNFPFDFRGIGAIFGMKIELRNVKYNKSMSDETPCFSATLYADGVIALGVFNRGCGGATEYGIISQKASSTRDLMAKIEAYAAAEYPNDGEPMESLLMDLFGQHLIRKELNSKMKTHIAMIEDGNLYYLKIRAGAAYAKAVEVAQQKYPKAQILNTVSIDVAVSAVNEIEKQLLANL